MNTEEIDDLYLKIMRAAFQHASERLAKINPNDTQFLISGTTEHIQKELFYNCLWFSGWNLFDDALVMLEDEFGIEYKVRERDECVIAGWDERSDHFLEDITDFCESLNINFEEKICPTLKILRIPEGMTFVGQFISCTGNIWNEIYLPDSLLWIDSGTFDQQSELKHIHFGKSLNRVGAAVFSNCNKLDTIILPDNDITLCESLFIGMRNLKNIHLGKPSKLMRDLFCYCNIESFTIPASVEQCSTIFNYCPNTKSLDFEENSLCTEIKDTLIVNCPDFELLKLPKSLTTIPTCLCKNCKKLKTVYAPKELNFLDLTYFENCPELKEITFF